MEQYIKKAATLVAELTKRAKHNSTRAELDRSAFMAGREKEDEDILTLLDTFEVKEVDLEKHLKEDIEDVYFDLNGVAVKGATYYLTVEDIKEIAKHFYELGLKAKGE